MAFKKNGNPFQLALINIMKEENLTQGDVSRAAGIARNLPSRYISGFQIPSLWIACKIMVALFDGPTMIKTINEMAEYEGGEGKEIKFYDSFVLNGHRIIMHDTGKSSITNGDREYYNKMKGSTIEFKHKGTTVSGKIIDVDIPFNCQSFGIVSQKIGFKLEKED